MARELARVRTRLGQYRTLYEQAVPPEQRDPTLSRSQTRTGSGRRSGSGSGTRSHTSVGGSTSIGHTSGYRSHHSRRHTPSHHLGHSQGSIGSAQRSVQGQPPVTDPTTSQSPAAVTSQVFPSVTTMPSFAVPSSSQTQATIGPSIVSEPVIGPQPPPHSSPRGDDESLP